MDFGELSPIGTTKNKSSLRDRNAISPIVEKHQILHKPTKTVHKLKVVQYEAPQTGAGHENVSTLQDISEHMPKDITHISTHRSNEKEEFKKSRQNSGETDKRLLDLMNADNEMVMSTKKNFYEVDEFVTTTVTKTETR